MSAEQLTCVPPTVEELLSAYRARLVEDMESAAGRAVKANTKMDEACEALKMFDGAMRAARDPEDGMTDEEAADALVAAVDRDLRAQWQIWDAGDAAAREPAQHAMAALLDRRRYLGNVVRDISEILGV